MGFRTGDECCKIRVFGVPYAHFLGKGYNPPKKHAMVYWLIAEKMLKIHDIKGHIFMLLPDFPSAQ